MIDWKKNLLCAAKVVYFSLGLVVLVVSLNGYHIHDAHIFWGWSLVLLSFPIGYLGAYVLGSIDFFFSNYTYFNIAIPDYLDLLFFWAFMQSLGYLQWFVVLPRVVVMVRKISSN